MKRPVRKVYKKLPPHSYEANPLASAGEASKPLIIAIIAIVAIIALAALLLFSKSFVGKAIELNSNTAGAELNSAKAYAGQAFSMNISANTQNEVNLVNVTVALPMGVNCNQVTITSKLQGWSEFQNQCSNNRVNFVSVSLGGNPQIAKGAFDAAQVVVQGLSNASYIFDLSFEAYDSSNKNVITQVTDPKVDVVDAVCGDGDKAPSEQCDDSNTVTEFCKYGEKSCQVCAFDCTMGAGQTAYCGDNKTNKDNGETCDGSELRGETCVSQGFTSGMLFCNADCKTFNTAACSKQTPAVCGNGVKEGSEQCDDNNTISNDGCSATCMTEQIQPVATCSDKIKNGKETDVDCGGADCAKCATAKVCVANSDCSTNLCENSTCKVSPVPPPPPTPAVCGNGVKEGEEQCDDNNTKSNDGCSAICMTEQQQVCAPNQYACQGTSSRKQCKADGSGYNEPVLCAEGQVCSAGVCGLAPVSATGKKITLTDVAPANNVFATKVTATESFTQEVTVYTILYGPDNKVLSIKSEKLEKGLAKDETYTAAVSYPETNVKKKSVLVFDLEQNPSVFGQLQVQKS